MILCKENNPPYASGVSFGGLLEYKQQQKQVYGANSINDSNNPVSGSNTIPQGMEARICGVLSQEPLPEAAGWENRGEEPECSTAPSGGGYW